MTRRPDDEIDIDWSGEPPPSSQGVRGINTIPVSYDPAATGSPGPRHDDVTARPPAPVIDPGTLPPDVIETISLPPEVLASIPPEPGPQATPVPVPLVDDVCGRFRLCFELASGGMATVFLARQEGQAGFEKLVALKRIHRHLEGEDQFVEMFLDEARVASLITHPNVCGVIDFGRANDQYYLAMEYLFGEPLSSVRRRLFDDRKLLPRSLPFVVRIIADAAEGLHAAHELRDVDDNLLNVVHRDIAPQNLFVGYDGNTKVVDFGIAKARGRLANTAAGVLKGHFAYMAPEQCRTSQIDRRADIWALGVVLWELVAGAKLFQTTSDISSTIMAVIGGPIRKASDVRPELPPDLDAIVMRCLTRTPGDRYPTAREMGRDLNRFLHQHCPPTGIAEVSDWMRSLFPGERAAKVHLVREARRARRIER